MRAKKLLTSRQIFRYAVPARTVTKSTGLTSMLHKTLCYYRQSAMHPGQSLGFIIHIRVRVGSDPIGSGLRTIPSATASQDSQSHQDSDLDLNFNPDTDPDSGPDSDAGSDSDLDPNVVLLPFGSESGSILQIRVQVGCIHLSHTKPINRQGTSRESVKLQLQENGQA